MERDWEGGSKRWEREQEGEWVRVQTRCERVEGRAEGERTRGVRKLTEVGKVRGGGRQQ